MAHCTVVRVAGFAHNRAMMRRWLFAFVFLGLAAGEPAHADPREALQGATAELDVARANFDVPALSVAVVVDGQVLMAQGFGRRGQDDQAAVDADTRFALGSCTKAFTSMGLALLAQEGRLSFDDLVMTRDPVLRLPMSGALDRLTLRHLLSQRSGLARHDFMWHARPEMSREAFAAAQMALPMRFMPGQSYAYTNSAYILAGRITELTSGLSWEVFTARRVFGPLGMVRSNFSAQGMAEDLNAAHATKRRQNFNRTVPWRDGRLLGPAGSINSTANDMARWLLMLTSGGTIEGQAFISPQMLDTLWTPVNSAAANAAADEDGGSGYALGWRVGTWRGLRRVAHGGAVDGFRARVTVFPEQRVGIAVMANLGPTQLPDLATRMLAERVLGLSRTTDLTAYAQARRESEAQALLVEEPFVPPGRVQRLQARDPSVAPSLPLESYYGVYTHPAYGDIRIEPAPDHAGLRIIFGTLGGHLDHWRGDSFIAYSDWPDDTLDEGEFVFQTAATGAVTGFTAMIDNDIAPVPFAYQGALPAPPAPEAAAPTALHAGAPGISPAGAIGLSGLLLAFLGLTVGVLINRTRA
jgi:CubicO group peptidase (beta-lactamase class C family)